MDKQVNPTVQQLLDELSERSFLVRQKEIVKMLEPYYDEAIPLLVKNLVYHGDNYNIRHNAIQVLALTADYRSIIPLIRHIEIETGWTKNVFDYVRQGLKDQDKTAILKFNNRLYKYLEEGPRIHPPEPDDPVAKEKNYNDFLSHLMKKSGVTELDEKTQKLAAEVKQKWMQPRDTTEEEKHKLSNIQEILVEVIETLSQFEGLNDSRIGTLLSKYIREYGFDSYVTQHALSALSKIEPSLATAHLNELAVSSPLDQENTIKRIIGRNPDSDTASFEFAICVREPGAEMWKEQVYYFIYEQGLVFLFARDPKIKKWFAGQASNQDDAIQLAINYLDQWIRNIDALAHIADRYAECIHVVQHSIDFEKWGFQQISIWQMYEYPHERPQIIYDSEWCRVKVSFRSYGEMHDQSDVLSILYGRSHAADKENTILWNGELHHCWHPVSLALCFLDNMSPEDTAKILWNHPLMVEYKTSHSGSQPSVEAGMHAMIWEHYGQRLFELFDLRWPNLWEKYSEFIKQVYDIKGWKHYGYGVPREKIC